ncbi:AAA family ATPase [Mycobacterium sp. 663a-19]|uniref:AAA family ATPase n=1 Tax=Mycobacterium sp. 663a-19 TaxID=2986148 RepID=UPI002D1F752B|nr:AAA family ATPase [Mycobacterium sp. 663a-19]MEB3981161.1 AAA family ATPase [Mycobacterium sp. 663a-19]
MKVHRLVLTNYRGIAHREIEFPDRGVVVVNGANEVGKSSMIEALDLLLEARDRSTKKEVKQVKPTHSDVGSEVTAEISCGTYRFIYRKRFHKKCETELTVLAPRREQLTGDEAHERVRSMLAETVDTELWRAQRVLQAASTVAVDLSGCDALSRALDVAAAQSDSAAALSGAEPLLIERIDAEYARYFTPTGRPTGEWSSAISRLEDAEAAVDECAAAVAEVDDRVRRHAALTEEVVELSQLRLAAGPRLAAARATAENIEELTRQAREAKLVAEAAAATSAAAIAAHTGRRRLLAEIQTRTATVAATEAEAQEAADAQAGARAAAEASAAAVEEAARALADLHRRVESARRTVDRLADREEADRLSARLGRIDATQSDRDAVCEELSAVVLTDELLQRVEDAAAAVDRTADQLASMSAAVEFTAATDIELVAGDQRVTLSAGQIWSTTATGPTEVDVPGILTARITPGATALDVQAKHAAARQELAAALAAAGVADLDAARRADQRRRELQSRRDQLSATLSGLCGDESQDQLRARLAALQAGQAEPELVATDITAARAELDAAEAARLAAEADCETRRQTAAEAASRLAETTTRTTLLLDKLATQRAELETVTDQLARERASVADADLSAAAESSERAATAAQQRAAELADELAAAAPDAVAAELAEAAAAADSLRDRYEDRAGALRQISIELSVIGGEGRQGKLDAAETEREHAAGEHTRVGQRARAAQLLRSVMSRHRDTTRLRYVEPYRAELQRLGRPVFGPTFEVDIDSDLCIRSRTLDGVTVPYESLSGGAKEQLGILARLAGAALVAKEDSVPVVVDDALGFTDPDRLAKMGEVFDTVGADGQVIVLTCSPDRYDGVKGALRIDLNV